MKVSALVLLSVLAAGCASPAGDQGPVVTSPGSSLQGGMGAQVKGMVVYEAASRCLRLDLEGVQYPVVWPRGTRWEETPPTVVLPGGARAEPGDSVHGGGGYLTPEHIRETVGDRAATEAARCIGPTGEVAFFNPGSRVDLVPD